MDMIHRKIIRQASLSTLIIGLGLVTSVVRVVFLTRVMSVSDYGTISVLLTTMMFFSYLFPLGTFQYVYKEAALGELPVLALKSVVIGAGATSILLALVAILLAPLFSARFGFGMPEWGLTLVASVLSGVLFVLIYYLYGQRQVVFYNFMLFLRGFAWLYVLIPTALLTELRLTVIWVVISWVALVAVTLVLAARRIGWNHLTKAPVDLMWFRSSVQYSFPLLPFFMSVWGMLAISKYILAYVSSTAQVALFSLAYTIFDMVYLVAVNVSQTLSPYIFAEWREEKQNNVYFDVALKYSIVLTVLLSLEVLLVGKHVVLLLASDAYIGATAFIPVMVFLPLLRVLSANVQQRLMATNRTGQMGIIYIVSLVSMSVCGVWWGQLWGVYGVIVALLFSQGILLVMITWKVRGEIRLRTDYFPFYRILLGSIVLVVLIGLCMKFFSSQNVISFTLAATLPAVYLIVLYVCGAISHQEIVFVKLGLERFSMWIRKPNRHALR